MTNETDNNVPVPLAEVEALARAEGSTDDAPAPVALEEIAALSSETAVATQDAAAGEEGNAPVALEEIDTLAAAGSAAGGESSVPMSLETLDALAAGVAGGVQPVTLITD